MGWTPHATHPHRYRTPENIPFDVLPATDEIVQSGILRFYDGVEMSSVGFDLVVTYAERVPLDEDVELELASLPTLFVLKVVAWLERPFERGKDLEDIVYLLEHALGEDDDRRWDTGHPVGAGGLAFDEQSAYFLGLEVARVCAEHHLELVRTFLERVEDPESAPFARMLRASRGLGGDSRYLSRLLALFARALV